MGVEKNISETRYPRQYDPRTTKVAGAGAIVDVCFNYNTKKLYRGVIVRDDSQSPFRTIIKLNDGRYLLGSECQYRTTGEVEETIIKESEKWRIQD